MTATRAVRTAVADPQVSLAAWAVSASDVIRLGTRGGSTASTSYALSLCKR